MAYSLDSSGILDLFRIYPPDVFPTIWTQMELAANSSIVFAIDEVYRELEKKDDGAFQWLKARRTMIIALDAGNTATRHGYPCCSSEVSRHPQE